MASQDDNWALIYTGKSRIGGLIPDVVIEENYQDTLQITEHPVEDGAAVSDHAYLRPKVVDMKIGWADYKKKSVGASTRAYESLLYLQGRRTELDVTTGKRIYKNMLIMDITVANDEGHRYDVIANVRLREVRKSTAKSVNMGTNNTSNPQSTLSPQSVGNQQPRILSQTTTPVIEGQRTRPPDAADVILQQSPGQTIQ